MVPIMILCCEVLVLQQSVDDMVRHFRDDGIMLLLFLGFGGIVILAMIGNGLIFFLDPVWVEESAQRYYLSLAGIILAPAEFGLGVCLIDSAGWYLYRLDDDVLG